MRLHHRRNASRLPLMSAILVATIFLLLPALAAVAKTPPGVHIDPGSPVAKQYSIPLAVARGAKPGSASPGQRFGAGITPSSGGGQGGSGGTAAASLPASSVSPSAHASASDTTHLKTHRTTPRGAKPTSSHAIVSAPAEAPPSPASTLHAGLGTGTMWMLGVAAIVLILGGATGYAVSSRGRRGATDVG